MQPSPASPKLSRNTRLMLWLVLAFFLSLGMAYAAVPLYRAFCQVTGIDGRGKRVEASAVTDQAATTRQMRVHFDTNVNGINWSFKVSEPYLDTRVGRTTLAHFTVKNLSDKPLTGRAVYNILPDTAGPYFLKIECFCFTDQTLKPGEEKTFPVVYFLDPKLMNNIDTKNLTDVTLSYTFFESKGGNS